MEQCKVLVVEDDADQGQLLNELLAEEGYDVRRARTGRDGLRILAEWKPRMVLLDVKLPDMDGRGFRNLQRSLNGSSDTPIILVSAMHGGALEAYARELEASACFEKPFDVEALLCSIKEHCFRE